MYRNSWNKSKPMSYMVNAAEPTDLPVTPLSFTDMNIFQNDIVRTPTDNVVMMPPDNVVPGSPESSVMIQYEDATMTQPGNAGMRTPDNAAITTPGNAGITMPGNASMTTPGNASMTMPGNSGMTTPGNASMTTPSNSGMTTPGNASMTMPGNASMTTPGNASMTTPSNAGMTTPGNASMTMPGNSGMTTPGNASMTTPSNSGMTTPGNIAGEDIFPFWDEIPVDIGTPTFDIPSLRQPAPNDNMPLGGPDAPSAGYSTISFPAVPPIFPDTPLVAAFPPAYPNVPVAKGCNIRILHADKNLGAITVILSDVTLVTNLSFGNVSDYSQEASGILLVTVTTVDNPFQYVVQETMRFNYGETYTIAIVPRGSGSSLFQITDVSCSKSLYNSCLRAINLSPGSIPLDVSLLDGRTIARNLSFLDIGGYKQFMPGTYRVIVYENRCRSNMQTENQHPVSDTAIPIIIGGSSSACMTFMLASSQIQINSNRLYTIYLIGYTTDSDGLTILFVESSF